ncbi:MAG: hypothetical protein IPL33_11140 [Sphingobacteriales bacterium]|nr:hypothetical protein [Sphingobacteriales bacterium]
MLEFVDLFTFRQAEANAAMLTTLLYPPTTKINKYNNNTMHEIMSYKEVLMSSLQTFAQQAMGTLSTVLGAIILLLIGWWVARTLAYLCNKLLQLVKFDQFAERVKMGDMLKKSKCNPKPFKPVEPHAILGGHLAVCCHSNRQTRLVYRIGANRQIDSISAYAVERHGLIYFRLFHCGFYPRHTRRRYFIDGHQRRAFGERFCVLFPDGYRNPYDPQPNRHRYNHYYLQRSDDSRSYPAIGKHLLRLCLARYYEQYARLLF